MPCHIKCLNPPALYTGMTLALFGQNALVSTFRFGPKCHRVLRVRHSTASYLLHALLMHIRPPQLKVPANDHIPWSIHAVSLQDHQYNCLKE